MICIYNKITRQRQELRKKTREHVILKYKKENQIFLKRNLKRKNRSS